MFFELRERRSLHRPIVETIDAGKKRQGFPLRQSLCSELLDHAEQRSPLLPLCGSVNEHNILPPAEKPLISSTSNTPFLITSASHLSLWPADSLPYGREPILPCIRAQ